MIIEFTPGEKYRNRRGEYELLEITSEGRLRVRYLEDGLLAELDRLQQERIIENILVQEQIAAAAAKVVPKVLSPRAAAAAKAKAAANPKASSSSASRHIAARPTASSSVLREELRVTLRPTVPSRNEFTKLEIFRLLQFIGFGKPDSPFWFIGGGEAFMENGSALISERIANEDFLKDFVDAAVYKPRFLEEGGYFYGSPTWRSANYLVTTMHLPPEEQTEEIRRRYFSEKFGSAEGDLLLADLIALPANVPTPNLQVANWPYRNITITDSPLYQRTLRDPQLFLEDKFTGRDTRIERLRDLYEDMKSRNTAPKYIFCHGKSSYANLFKEIFPKVQSYTPLEIPSYLDKERPVRTAIGRDEDNGTLVVLTPVLVPSEGATPYYLDRLIEFCLLLAARK